MNVWVIETTIQLIISSSFRSERLTDVFLLLCYQSRAALIWNINSDFRANVIILFSEKCQLNQLSHEEQTTVGVSVILYLTTVQL